MRSWLSKAGKRLAVVGIVLGVAAGLLWWQRAPALTWYGLRGLARADESDRAAWVDFVVRQDAAAPGLIDLLRQGDARVCISSENALTALAQRWGAADARTAALAEELLSKFGGLGKPGKQAVMEWYLALLQGLDSKKTASGPMTVSACKLLALTARMPDPGLKVRTLALAEVLLGRNAAPPVEICRDLAVQGMASKDEELCAGGIRLIMHAPLHTDKGLVGKVVPFLKDASPLVRRAAVLAIGLAEETIAVQDMLPLLQDPDAEVRRLGEVALRGRGLQDNHIKLARLITDQRPGQRLQVVHYLSEAADLDPGIWLMHLSQDSSPAVRAAAIRFAAEDPAAASFKERMLQMAREDDSATVRQLAEFYLKKVPR